METVFTVLIPITFVTFLTLERLAPARAQPTIPFWLLKGFGFFVMTAVISTVPPAILAGVLASHAALHLDRIGWLPAGLVAFFVTDLLHYAIHRLQHNWPWLWRWTHQMHHSAERVDVAGSAVFHPFELALFSVISTVVSVMLGISPESAALAGFLGAALGMFTHLNVRTPRWLGYVIQRPEAHSIHHARGVHAYNYGNLMLWDLALGTFRHPVTFTGPYGFWDGASRQLVPMLAGRDVADPTH